MLLEKQDMNESQVAIKNAVDSVVVTDHKAGSL